MQQVDTDDTTKAKRMPEVVRIRVGCAINTVDGAAICIGPLQASLSLLFFCGSCLTQEGRCTSGSSRSKR